MVHKEHDKHYKKVVKNPMLYLEECYHQIDPVEHQLEVHSMRFFEARAESAAIEVLALIDLATEFLELSRSPVPEILAFLRCPFIMGKKVQFPIPEDPGDAIQKEKCVCTKAQKEWVYLCELLQFWTDEAMTESGEIMYGGRRRPANARIVQIRAVLNLQEDVQETKDLSFTTPSWADAAARLQLLSGQPEARHLTEAESVPPGFTRT